MGARLVKRSRGRRRSHTVMSEINVTPLVDVMLVLLIVFMVTAPLMTAGVSVNLPKTASKTLSQQDNAPLEVTVDKKGNVFMGKTAVKMDRLKEILSTISQENPDRRVYIRADRSLPYGKVMAVMAVVSSSGFTRITLVSDSSAAKK
ncbi:MAG: protein TolR [Alphaproteobacteria bacterium]|nr:protein TolR [Alphaproteobacteria bacterium]MCK5659137.1 protein TolR [Alphaproteobacteria bacterium]